MGAWWRLTSNFSIKKVLHNGFPFIVQHLLFRAKNKGISFEGEIKVKAKGKNGPIILLLLLMYVIVAMGDNFKGIFVPIFKEEFGVSNTAVGYVLTAALFAYALFQYIGGILVERIGYKKTITVGSLGGIAALLVLIGCKNFAMLILGMFLLNAGMAMFNIGVNTLGPALSVGSTVVLMNMINFTYCVSNTTIQKVSGILLANQVPWRSFYFVMLVAMCVLFVYQFWLRIPYVPAAEKGTWNKKELFANPMLYLYIALVGFYLLAEYGIGNWFANYMNESFQLNADSRSFYVALFFGSQAVGRLMGGFIVDKVGKYKSIILYGAVAAVMLFFGIFLGRKGLLLFSLAGFACSIIFPTTIASVRDVFGDAASYATGFISMWATFLAMAGSMLIGLLNDHVGTQTAFYVVPAALLLTTISGELIRRYKITVKLKAPREFSQDVSK